MRVLGFGTDRWLIHGAHRNRDKKMTKHELLSAIELPRPGTVAAIDAEFVQMQQVRWPQPVDISDHYPRKKSSTTQTALGRSSSLLGSASLVCPSYVKEVPRKANRS